MNCTLYFPVSTAFDRLQHRPMLSVIQKKLKTVDLEEDERFEKFY